MNLHDAVANPPITSGRPTSRTRQRTARAERRTPYRVPCRVRLIDPLTGELKTVLGETLNLSSGGMSLQISVDTPVGTWLETMVPHTNGDPLFLCGTVVHSRRTMTGTYEVGVEADRPPTFV